MTAGRAKKETTKKKTARDLFGEAFRTLGERKYEKAATMFDKLINSFPEEEEVLARAKTFQRACQRALEEKSPKKPKRSAEQHFDMGVFHHNNQDFAAATDHFQKAMNDAGAQVDYIHYAWAATKAQQGNFDEALAELKKAAKIDSVNLHFARNDPDFEPLREHDGFRELLGIRR